MTEFETTYCEECSDELETGQTGQCEDCREKAAQALFKECQELQDQFWTKLNALEEELGFEIDSSRDFADMTLDDLRN